MRDRLFAFKGTKDQARKKVLKALEKKKMLIVDRGEPIRFRSSMITPVRCQIKFQDAEKHTEVQMMIYTAFWYYIVMVLASLAPFATGVYYLGQYQFLSAISMLFGVLIFISAFLGARILEKQNDLFISQLLHPMEFF